jgi:hypothetical protein
MLPVINAFKTAHNLTDVTVVADAGMISGSNQVALQAAGLSFILGIRLPQLPDVVREWRDKHADEAIPDGLVLSQPWPATSSEKARGIPERVIYYQPRCHVAVAFNRGMPVDSTFGLGDLLIDAAQVRRARWRIAGVDQARQFEAAPSSFLEDVLHAGEATTHEV